MKPGYKTTEFWFTLVSFIFSGLFLIGIVGDYDQKEELTSVVSHAVESIILIAGQMTIFYKYIQNRKIIKVETEKTHQEELKNQDIENKLEHYTGVAKEKNTISINTDELGDLIQLPSIGPSLAKRILDYRSAHGNFEHAEDILKVKGIAEIIYKNIKPYIVV